MVTFVELAASHTLYTWVKLWLRWNIEFPTCVVTSQLGGCKGSNGFRGSNGSSGWNWNLKGSNDFKGSNALQWLALGIWKKIKDWVSDMCGDKSMVVGCKTNKSQSCASLPARSDIGINRPTTTTTKGKTTTGKKTTITGTTSFPAWSDIGIIRSKTRTTTATATTTTNNHNHNNKF